MVSTAFPSPALPAGERGWERPAAPSPTAQPPPPPQAPEKAGGGGRRRVLVGFDVMQILRVYFSLFHSA